MRARSEKNITCVIYYTIAHYDKVIKNSVNNPPCAATVVFEPGPIATRRSVATTQHVAAPWFSVAFNVT